MTSDVQWEIRARADREAIFRYLYQEAGLPVASATDDKFVSMSASSGKTRWQALKPVKQQTSVSWLFPGSRSSSSILRKKPWFVSCIHPGK